MGVACEEPAHVQLRVLRAIYPGGIGKVNLAAWQHHPDINALGSDPAHVDLLDGPTEGKRKRLASQTYSIDLDCRCRERIRQPLAETRARRCPRRPLRTAPIIQSFCPGGSCRLHQGDPVTGVGGRQSGPFTQHTYDLEEFIWLARRVIPTAPIAERGDRYTGLPLETDQGQSAAGLSQTIACRIPQLREPDQDR
ncbi:hypothetical protein GCM10022295_07690 [Streptomyces osmaniensis]|uniref:Uncharacterized protein n=1 Tax=Streptomyces osmaniensis TaxID=593134 RepID=A0ABP6V4H9_9ACTN